MPGFQFNIDTPLLTAIGTFFVIGGIFFLLFAVGVIQSGEGTDVIIKIKSGWPAGITGSFGIIAGVLCILYSTSIPVNFTTRLTDSSKTAATPPPLYLSELTPLAAKVGFGKFSAGKYDFDEVGEVKKGDPIILHGIEYAQGLYAHAPSQVIYDLQDGYSELSVTIALVDTIQCGDGAEFVISLDGNQIYRSKRMASSSTPERVSVSIADGQRLILSTSSGPAGNLECDWTIWGDPLLR
jgi:hypothetical protein